MNFLKTLVLMSVLCVPFVFTGCEGGGDDPITPVVDSSTNSVSQSSHDDSDNNSSESTVTSNSGGSNNSNPPPATPPPPAPKIITVHNNATATVLVTVGGNAVSMAAGSSHSWSVTGNTTAFYDTQLGYDSPAQTITYGDDWDFTLVGDVVSGVTWSGVKQ